MHKMHGHNKEGKRLMDMKDFHYQWVVVIDHEPRVIVNDS